MTLPRTLALSLFLTASSSAFAPAAFSRSRATSLDVSVVSEFVKNRKEDADTKKLRIVFETETPQSVGVKAPGIQKERRKRNNRNKRKHNYAQQQEFLREDPDLDFYTLHSSAVSHLQKDTPINDILRAIKRAQNRHDAHDLATIGAFLIDECDEHWGYGFRGSLLSRLAVAALHMDEVDIAMKAIETRRVYERASMQPHESAAIVRGLMRAGMPGEGWEVLEDELRLPMDGASLDDASSQEMLKHRARSLASIASRHFYSGEPYVAAEALSKLQVLGSSIEETHMNEVDLDMPWARLVAAAGVCEKKIAEKSSFRFLDPSVEIPSEVAELVFDTMLSFPCPGEQEECSLDDYFLTP